VLIQRGAKFSFQKYFHEILLAKIIGMASSCIGLGRSKPLLTIPIRTSFLKHRSSHSNPLVFVTSSVFGRLSGAGFTTLFHASSSFRTYSLDLFSISVENTLCTPFELFSLQILFGVFFNYTFFPKHK
jgi:hypothetical protein